MGVDGVVFPMIRNADAARKAISGTFYPPRGCRGFGPRRPVRYGLDQAADYIEKGSLEMCRFIQIEHIEAVEGLEEIAETEGVDGFIFGPCDLAGSIGQLTRPYEETAMELMQKKAPEYSYRAKPLPEDFLPEPAPFFQKAPGWGW